MSTTSAQEWVPCIHYQGQKDSCPLSWAFAVFCCPELLSLHHESPYLVVNQLEVETSTNCELSIPFLLSTGVRHCVSTMRKVTYNIIVIHNEYIHCGLFVYLLHLDQSVGIIVEPKDFS